MNITTVDALTPLPETPKTSMTSPSSGLPLFGHPGGTFYVIHSLSITSASISWVASAGVVGYLLSHMRNPWKKPIGERLVFYLAICDVMFSTSRDVDHVFLLVNKAHLPDSWCAVDAFVTVTFFYAQVSGDNTSTKLYIYDSLITIGLIVVLNIYSLYHKRVQLLRNKLCYSLLEHIVDFP